MNRSAVIEHEVNHTRIEKDTMWNIYEVHVGARSVRPTSSRFNYVDLYFNRGCSVTRQRAWFYFFEKPIAIGTCPEIFDGALALIGRSRWRQHASGRRSVASLSRQTGRL